jgi:hypothetical protein
MNGSNFQPIMPTECDMRYVHQFVEVMQSYKSQMQMVIAGLDTPEKKKGAKYFRNSIRRDEN